MINYSPLIIVISGPSGAGKNSVADALRQIPERFVFSITYTTRKHLRPGEINGQDYHFVSDEEFDRGIKDEEFLEWQPVFDNRYGTKKADFEKLLLKNKIVVTLLDVKGAMTLKKIYPHVATFFVTPPDPEVAALRLSVRGTETKEVQDLRRERYGLEMAYKDKYDHIIINDDLLKAQRDLLELVGQEERAIS